MNIVKVTTQAELAAALEAPGNAQIWLVGAGLFKLSDSAHVRASDSAQVTAYGSAHVWASGSAQVTASDSAQVTASKYVAVTSHGKLTKVEGGVRITIPAITTVKAWCAYHGISIETGVVTIYKAVNAQYQSSHGGDYTPGTIPVATYWDGGKNECGGGLHFSPRPCAALRFAPDAVKFLACPVRVSDIRAPRKGDSYPDKVKAKGCCAPVYEVDINGNPIQERNT